jgi:alkylation response protein AidB-like acyl-CoA dehydrogenase
MEGAAPVSEPTTTSTRRDLLYGGVEDDVRASARKLLADRCPPDVVLARCETEAPYDLATWRTLSAELGFAGLLVPEQRGGAGATAREAAVVAEELGRSVAPLPFLGSAVLATAALLECGDDDLLAALADGSRTGTLAVPLSAAPSTAFPTSMRATGSALSGRMRSVVDLDVADMVIVPATDEDGPALYAVDLPSPGATPHPVVPLDLTRRVADLELDGARGRRVAGAGEAEAALRTALTTGAGLLASEQLGLAEWCLDTTVEYGKTRYQFGRPIGSFQAVKHRLADVWAAVSTARSVARTAADALATGTPDTELVVAVAAAYCSDTAVLAAEECVQLHGGIGMTWEHPAHLYLGRAKSSQLALGTPDRHRAMLSSLVDLPTS